MRRGIPHTVVACGSVLPYECDLRYTGAAPRSVPDSSLATRCSGRQPLDVQTLPDASSASRKAHETKGFSAPAHASHSACPTSEMASATPMVRRRGAAGPAGSSKGNTRLAVLPGWVDDDADPAAPTPGEGGGEVPTYEGNVFLPVKRCEGWGGGPFQVPGGPHLLLVRLLLLFQF